MESFGQGFVPGPEAVAGFGHLSDKGKGDAFVPGEVE